jgi:hypothetical protein
MWKCQPNCPMNAVSSSEAIGSAANASEAGIAMRSISEPRSSSLNTRLQVYSMHTDFVSRF